jgi:exopolysaccharide/PEP-CTERM locus tyrosine autokinase
MSKIEKALSRARRDAGLALVPIAGKTVASAPEGAAGRDLVRSGVDREMAPRAAAAESIARMHELERRGRDELAEQRIISPDVGENATVQAFREIRTRVLQRTQGQNGIILVTSVTAGSGNSFVAVNLGVAFAFDAGRTALLVDCNLRAPSLQRLAGGMDKPGITDYLEDARLNVADIIHPVGIERLRVIPAGSRRDIPTEYFTSQRVRQLLDGIRARYAERFVILDAPPMTESADTQILAELCDYILLVVPYGRVTDMQVESCIKALDNRKFIGVVFNDDPQPPNLDWRHVLRQALSGLQQVLASVWQRLLRKNGTHKNARTAKK